MRVLHTSDWHLGADLCEKSRLEEHRRFLHWLCDLVRQEHIEAMLVAGDIFDTTAPSNRAVALYFNFLRELRQTPCRHVVITGGNHDSPSHLNAPGGYFDLDGIHVVGCAEAGHPEKEVLVLDREDGTPGLVVCAVPFLRDRDVRTSGFGINPAERDRAMCQGIAVHYRTVADRARDVCASLPAPCPVVGMGHLFAAGSNAGDGETTITVGTLGAVNADMFTSLFSYTALGHIHSHQRVGSDLVRYSGSPLAMTFGERRNKVVLVLDFAGAEGGAPDPFAWPCEVREVEVPRFRRLVQVKGSVEEIVAGLRALAPEGGEDADELEPWVEADYNGDAPLGSGRDRIFGEAKKLPLQLLRVRDLTPLPLPDFSGHMDRDLQEYNPRDIFTLCLETRHIPGERRELLNGLFDQVVNSLDELAEDRDGQEIGPAAEAADQAGDESAPGGNGERDADGERRA